MVKGTKQSRRVTEGHLKQIGVLKATQKRYWHSLIRFFAWRRQAGLAQPKSLDELDTLVGVYINWLFQRRLPQYLGHDLISGLRRFFPVQRTLCTRGGLISKLEHHHRTPKGVAIKPGGCTFFCKPVLCEAGDQ